MKKTTITIGIPAFNEEQNIEAILRSILAQKVNTVIIENIYVYSDASTDKTNEIVNKIRRKYSSITLIVGKTRKGKYFRVNELFKMNKSDILVIFDADIAIVGNKFIETITKALVSDEDALLVAAHNIFIYPTDFIARVLYAHFILWDYIQLSVPTGDIAPLYSGTATAYRKEFASSVIIPENVIDPHFYIYLAAKKRNGFRYCRDADILQYLPATIADMKKLMNRSIGKKDEALEKIFGEKLIQDSLVIPTRSKIIGILKCFLAYPLYTPFAILVSFYLGRISRPGKVDKTPIWEINQSTKKPIIYAK